ncbi:hypothetical protein KR038_005008 [Drosophila bunnanda]|nr:hypothetical protein KR038_005008 [Drosophila bunnanda]
MVPTIFNGLSLCIYMFCTLILFSYYIPCLAHCIKFFSWEQCAHPSVDQILMMTSVYGLSGFLWVSGTYREYHVLYIWVIVTAQLIVFMCAYIVYANMLAGFYICLWDVLSCGILLSGFGLVLIYLLENKKVIGNPLIKNFLNSFSVPDGKV